MCNFNDNYKLTGILEEGGEGLIKNNNELNMTNPTKSSLNRPQQ